MWSRRPVACSAHSHILVSELQARTAAACCWAAPLDVLQSPQTQPTWRERPFSRPNLFLLPWALARGWLLPLTPSLKPEDRYPVSFTSEHLSCLHSIPFPLPPLVQDGHERGSDMTPSGLATRALPTFDFTSSRPHQRCGVQTRNAPTASVL